MPASLSAVDYQIMVEETPAALETAVNNLLGQGYLLFGGPSCYFDSTAGQQKHCQALIKQ